jgi:hypothetical protein
VSCWPLHASAAAVSLVTALGLSRLVYTRSKPGLCCLLNSGMCHAGHCLLRAVVSLAKVTGVGRDGAGWCDVLAPQMAKVFAG